MHCNAALYILRSPSLFPSSSLSISIPLPVKGIARIIIHILQEEKEIPGTLVAPGISAELDKLKDVWKGLPSKILEVRELMHI